MPTNGGFHDTRNTNHIGFSRKQPRKRSNVIVELVVVDIGAGHGLPPALYDY